MNSPTISASAKNIVRGISNFADMADVSKNGRPEYQCGITDPQCQLQLVTKPGPGYYDFQFHFLIKEGKIKNPKLYFDTGAGYNESETMILPKSNGAMITTLIYLSKKVINIRFDPTENSSAIIEISNLSLQKINIINLFKKIYTSLIQSSGSKSVLRNFFKAALITFKNDPDEIKKLISHHTAAKDPFFYQDWIDSYDSYTEPELRKFKQIQSGFSYRPLISILLPTYNTSLVWLNECISSVFNQVYDNWELCIADDNSTNEEVRKMITRLSAKSEKIKYTFRSTNGHIAISSNTAFSLATGEFAAFLDHDDKLAPLALYRIVEDLNKDNTSDFFYSDEDKINEEGQRSLPFFKPDWSPTLFYAQNYITHLACIRIKFLQQVNGFTEGLHGSQDYDLFLNILAAGAKIKHLPFILYHWRLHKESTSMESSSKPYAHIAGKQALENYLSKKYPFHYSKVDDGKYTFTYMPRYHFNTGNKISVIIPTKDNIEYLKPCIESIIIKSTWKNYEIIILNNNSEEEKSFSYFREIQEKYNNIKVIDAFFEFNWSKLNNFGCKNSTGNFLIFLNNDIAVITPDWMERLCECASLPDIGVVGASLLYEDNTLQHAGVIVGMNGWGDHVFKGMYPSHYPSPFISNEIQHNALAVTGACLAIERSKFENLGMFDESFIICGSDVELGIRAYKMNLYNAIQSNVKLYHYESKSRGSFIPENDFIQSALKYEPFRTQKTDPFFNPNLSLIHTSPTCKS
jgi:GT2 family glycosyltransferase